MAIDVANRPIDTAVQFFLDNILLIGVAFVSGAMLVWPLVRGKASGPTLSTLQATQLINSRNPQVVDLRNADEFAKGIAPQRAQHPGWQGGRAHR